MNKEKIDFKYHHIKHYKYQAQSKKTLITSILLTLFFALVELFGGIFSGSLALISDSFHMFSDVIALLFSIIAVFYSAKKPNKNFTYGFLRIEIISAFINGLALMIISVGIVIEAVKRLFNPEHVDFFTMFTIAVIGLLVNIILMFVLMKSLKKENNLNVKSALWHFLGDTLNSVGVIIAAIILKLTNLVIFDIIISVIISVVIFTGGLKIAKEAFFILMAFLALGEFVSVKTRAIVPSILIFLILLLAGVWGGFLPKEIIDLGGFSEAMTEVIMVVIVVNMGSSLSLDSLKKEWKTVLIGLGAIAGIAAVILPIGSMIYDWQTAVVAAPPIAGGFVAAFEMSKTSLAKGLPHLSTIALLLLALQEFPVYFILPGLLRSETLRRLDLFRKGELKAVSTEAEENKKRLIPAIPEKYMDTSTYLFLLGLVGMLAILASTLSGKIFNSFVIT